jgi:predicted GIY-YIG superfamily endonuclease
LDSNKNNYKLQHTKQTCKTPSFDHLINQNNNISIEPINNVITNNESINDIRQQSLNELITLKNGLTLMQQFNKSITIDPIENKSPHLCYIIYSTVIEKVYIGYTIDFSHRIRQHNGEIAGGAKQTRIGRPWTPLCTIHGFPNNHIALRFEWRLQHIKHSDKRKDPNEPILHFAKDRLCKIISVGDGTKRKNDKRPWPQLHIQWRLPNYHIEHPTITNTLI